VQSPFGHPLAPIAGPRRAILILAGACAGVAIAVALTVIAALLSAPAVVDEVVAGAAVVVSLAGARTIPRAVTTLRGARRARKSVALAELRRNLAELPETPHPLGL
jgi:hypothetical protein